MPEVQELVDAINAIGKFGVSDMVVILISVCSLVVASASFVIVKIQKDVSERSERLSIHTELFDILHYLKSYNGECDDKADEYFKRLQKIKAVSGSACSKKAGNFVQELLDKMHEMPTRYAAFVEGIPEGDVEVLKKYGIDPNVAELLKKEYFELKKYFRNTAFEKFEELFPV